jgi:AraC-like DNA-binding protein
MHGTVRTGIIWYLPHFLAERGIDTSEVLAVAGLPGTAFDSPDRLIGYGQLGRIFSETERRTGSTDVGLQLARHTRLENFGLPGRWAQCADTAGAGLRSLAESFNLHSTGSAVSVLADNEFARFVCMIVETGMTETYHFQIAGAAISCNILRDLFGPQWRARAVTFACRAPKHPRSMQRHFDAPLRFDCAETAVHFESHWLERPLPPVDPQLRAELQAAVEAGRAAMLEDLPAVVRRLVRKQILLGPVSMSDVASFLSMHRRTLDRHLQRSGARYGDIVESVRKDIARQLLRDTTMPIQQIAESVRYSSAANFATAFRRSAGMTPSEYRGKAGGSFSRRAGSRAPPGRGRSAGTPVR